MATRASSACPAEELDKVHYRLFDASDHEGENVMVVGGGDSAVEAAVALSEHANVTMSYRREEFFRLQSKNREKIDAASDIDIRFETEVEKIEADTVTLKGQDPIPNDRVFVAIGSELPHAFFKSVGIRMEKSWTAARLIALGAVFFAFWLMYAGKKYPPLWPWSAWGIGWNDLQLTPNLHWWEWFTILYSAATLIWGHQGDAQVLVLEVPALEVRQRDLLPVLHVVCAPAVHSGPGKRGVCVPPRFGVAAVDQRADVALAKRRLGPVRLCPDADVRDHPGARPLSRQPVLLVGVRLRRAGGNARGRGAPPGPARPEVDPLRTHRGQGGARAGVRRHALDVLLRELGARVPGHGVLRHLDRHDARGPRRGSVFTGSSGTGSGAAFSARCACT